MLEKYLEKQEIATNLLLNEKKNNKIVQAYLFVSEDKSFLMQYSLDFAKEIISDEYDEMISKQIDDNNYPELKIIESSNGNIKKEQLIELQESFSVRPVLGNKLVYIIAGAEDLNSASANTILKFLEEPSDCIVAILLTDNLQKVLSTVKSRCQIIVFKNDKKSEDVIFENYKNIYTEDEYNEETFNYLTANILEIIKKIDIKKIKTYIYYKNEISDIYKDKRDYIFLFDFILYFYYDMLNFKLHRDLVYMNKYTDYIEALDLENTFESITKKLQIIENTKNNLETNMNLKLLMDDFIIKMSEV
jgi:DNA polymerase-3 subunit delta'